MTTATKPTAKPKPRIEGFRNPWEGGAKAYPEADTFSAAKEGFRRKRKGIMFHMPNSGEAGKLPCTVCGVLLKDPYDVNGHTPSMAHSKTDTNSTWNYDPKTKKVYGGRHYYCSWVVLLTAISKMHSY